MSKRTGEGYLKGQTKGRSQFRNPNGTYTVRDTDTGQFTRGGKKSPYKNVRKE